MLHAPTETGGIAIEHVIPDNKLFVWETTNDRWTIVP